MGRDAAPFASTMWDDSDAVWNAHVHVVDARKTPESRRVVWGLYRESFRRRCLILNGAVPARQHYRDLVAALLVRRLGGRCHVLITDATWLQKSDHLSRTLPWLAPLVPAVARTAIRLLDGPRVHYGVLSSAEAETFPELWGVSAARVHFIPFSHTLYDADDQELPEDAEPFFFAGGNSLRDYGLLEAAVASAQVPMKVASSWRPSTPTPGLEVETLSHQQFVAAMRRCAACVVPLAVTARSAGQQTYLNAMLLAKPVIVTDAPGVRDYVHHGETGLVVPHDPAALAAALRHITDPANAAALAEMGRTAREDVLARFTPAQYRARLLRLAEDVSAATAVTAPRGLRRLVRRVLRTSIRAARS